MARDGRVCTRSEKTMRQHFPAAVSDVIDILSHCGTDGPAAVGGGLVAGKTVAFATACGSNAEEHRRTRFALDLLDITGDFSETGPGEANVNDPKLVLVGG